MGRSLAQVSMSVPGVSHGLLAQLGGAGEQQRVQLVDCLGAGLDRAAAGHTQRADRLDAPVAAFGCGRARPDRAASAAA